MNEIHLLPKNSIINDTDEPGVDRVPDTPPGRPRKPRRFGGRLVFGAVALLLLGGLGTGAWRHYEAQLAIAATAEQNRDFAPNVRVAAVRANNGFKTGSPPAHTPAAPTVDVLARTPSRLD